MIDDTRRKRARADELALIPPPSITRPPTYWQLMLGWPFFWDHPSSDLVAWARERLADAPNEAVRTALAAAGERGTVRAALAIGAAYDAAAADTRLPRETRDECQDHAIRARISAAFLGDVDSALRAALDVDTEYTTRHCDAERRFLLVTRQELMETARHATVEAYRPARSRGPLRGQVWVDLVARAEVVSVFKETRPTGPVRDDIWFLPDDLDEAFGAEPVAETNGVVVFPAAMAEHAGKEVQKELKRYLGDALGARLPLVPVPEDWDAWERRLIGEAPWMAPFVRAVRASQGGRTHWGGGVICVEGPPGAGKTRMARRIAEVSGLPVARFNCDNTSDNSGLGGTSIRWLSAHPGVVDRLLSSSRSGNGVVILDEIPRASGSRRNGAGEPHDLMHGLFEPESARAWRSPYLLAEIDVSHVLYLCTANETASLPSSLRDRMRIVRVGEPEAGHLGVLAPALAREACRELGLDERWGALDAEELAALAEAWQGGSIRRLAKLVSGVLQARDAAPVARD